MATKTPFLPNPPLVSPLPNGVGIDVEPEVLQSGFGVIFLFWPGEFLENCRQISRKFDGDFFPQIFRPYFFQSFPPPNSRPNVSAFLSNFTFSNPNVFHAGFLLAGETKTFRLFIFCWCQVESLCSRMLPWALCSRKGISEVVGHDLSVNWLQRSHSKSFRLLAVCLDSQDKSVTNAQVREDDCF